MKKTITDKCGCVSEGGERGRWVKMCKTHADETAALHKQANEQYQAGRVQREHEANERKKRR